MISLCLPDIRTGTWLTCGSGGAVSWGRGVVSCAVIAEVSNRWVHGRVFLFTLPTQARNSHAVLWVALAVLPTLGDVREYSQV